MNATEYETLTGHAPVQDDLERVNCTDGQEGHRNCGTCADCGKPRTQCAVDVTVSEWSTEPWRAQLNSLAYDMRKLAERMEAIAVDSHAIGSLIRRERWTQDHMSALLTHVKHANNDTYVPEVQN